MPLELGAHAMLHAFECQDIPRGASKPTMFVRTAEFEASGD